MKRVLSKLFWLVVAGVGAEAYAVLALHRGEALNSVYILMAALCSYAVGYRFYSKWIAARVLALNDRRATPCEVHDDGKDFVKTNRWIVFGHHFAAISGPGPLVGPVLAAQFGYLPGTLWILIGVVLGGAVQDFVVLVASIRRDGRSLGQMVKDELNSTAGHIALVGILSILVIILAVLGLVVVKALAESPWGVFTVGATIPIAMLMGGYLRFWRVGKVMEASASGVVLLLLAVWGGKLVYRSPELSGIFGVHDITLAWLIIGYGLAASVLPIWLLLAPRDYLSTFMKLGTIFALAVGIFCVLPQLQMPALSRFVDGKGLVIAGKIFPFCFITIACGAISGFHTLIASGTTPKMITREGYARPVGYGAMCLESLVAIMALIAACTLEPGVYLSMNVKGVAAETVAKVTSLGFPVTVEQMQALATQLGEPTLFGRTGGAATLAVGMANIFGKVVGGRFLDLWYHFAVVFEALFIMTTLDAGTRVGRYLLQDMLGNVWAPLGDTKRLGSNLLASALMVSGWGYFLVQGVRVPLGGINSLWPLFGIANQMLAAIALCLATTIILKTELRREPGGRPALALVTVLPMFWLVSVTFTAGFEKILHSDPRIGFLATVKMLDQQRPGLEATWEAAKAGGNAQAGATAGKALRNNRTLAFNNRLDAVVAGIFLALVGLILLVSAREWLLLLARKKLAELRETPPVWLSEAALAEGKPLPLLGTVALLIALARELSGEAHMDRLQDQAQPQACCHHEECGVAGRSCDGAVEGQQTMKVLSSKEAYLQSLEKRFAGVRRCC